jgi:hypothetical protein
MHQRVNRAIAVWLLWMGALGLAGQPAQASIMINEVLFNPGGLDVNNDGVISASGDEFVELVNTETLPLSLDGWSLKDALAIRHTFGPTAIVPGLGFLVVFGAGASTGTLALNNTGDTVSLLDPSVVVIDQLIYSQSLSGASLTRSPDGTGAFVDHRTASSAAFSPGLTTQGERQLANSEQTPDPVVPEPTTWWLVGMGSVALAGIKRWRAASVG